MPAEVTRSSEPPADEADLTRTYVLVIVVEAIVILALYWLGRVFS
jgi:hypothetical protein